MIRCPFCDHEQGDFRHECEACGASLVEMEGTGSAPGRIDDEIIALLAENRRIEAIQRIRDATGASVSEAVAELDRIAEGRRVERVPPGDRRIEVLLREGRKIEAVKLYREQTGAGLKEAKDQVEAIQRTLGYDEKRSGSGSCGAIVVSLVVAGLGFVLAFWLSIR